MKKHLISLIVGCIFFGIGITMTILNVFDYDYINSFSDSKIKQSTLIFNDTINNKNFFVAADASKANLVTDDKLAAGNIKIVVKYYGDFTRAIKRIEETPNYKLFKIDIDFNINNFEQTKKLFNVTIDALKDKKIYNYSALLKSDVTVYCNSADSNYVKIGNYN